MTTIKKTIKKTTLPIGTMVMCYDGQSNLKDQCHQINGLWYKLGNIQVKGSGQVFEIDGTKYRLSNGKIAWSITQNKYIKIEGSGEVPVIVDKNYEIAYCNPVIHNTTVETIFPFFNNGDIDVNRDSLGIVESAIGKNPVMFDFTIGRYASKSYVSGRSGGVSKQVLPKHPNYETLPNNIYSLSEYPTDSIVNMFEKGKAKHFKPSVFDTLFGNYKYGLEVETEKGFFPECLYYKYGCAPLKDGSIAGTEITTLPFSSADLAITSYIMQFMGDCAKFTECTRNNSLHVNIGNIAKNNPSFRVALYLLYRRLEDEIEAMTPIYKRDAKYLATKQGGPKDHCKRMNDLGFGMYMKNYNPAHATCDQEYETYVENADKLIFQMLNNGHAEQSDYNRRNRNHVAANQPKWEHHGRYHTLNLEPLYFGPVKYARVEYRVHSGTVNPHKTYLWMLICTAITRYAEDNTKTIITNKQKITLSDVIDHYTLAANLSETNAKLINRILTEYIQRRIEENTKRIFANSPDCNDEFQNDCNYTVNVNGGSITRILLSE